MTIKEPPMIIKKSTIQIANKLVPIQLEKKAASMTVYIEGSERKKVSSILRTKGPLKIKDLEKDEMKE